MFMTCSRKCPVPSLKLQKQKVQKYAKRVQLGIEQVQALADISCSALCCHSNGTRALVANLPNTAQLEGTTYHSAKLHLGPCSSVGMWQGTDTQTAATTTHFASATSLAKCNKLQENNFSISK